MSKAALKPEESTDRKLVGNIDEHIADLETVIKGITYPLTISINGEWGAGKTVFLKEWAKKKATNSIYIDAFATDYIDNPLAVILSEISEYFKYEPLFNKLRSEKIDFEKITKTGFAELVKLLTASVIDLNSATKENALNGKIADLTKIKNAIIEFKSVVSKSQTDKQKLYVFIDELDRCRPTYAVEFIEIVKHFFEIDNTVFIFAINRKELVSSIKHVQGCFDEDRYLKKFFNLNYDLPPVPTRDFIELLTRNDEKTLALSDEYFDKDFIDIFTLYAKGFNLEPRDQEQVFTKIVLALKKHHNMNAKSFIHPLILMAILRDNKRSYYDKLREGTVKPPDLLQEMNIGTKYLKGASDIQKCIFEKWAEFITLDKKAIMSMASEEFYEIQRQSRERQRHGNYIESPEEKSFLDKKYSFLQELNENELDITNGERLIEYIDELLNFSSQFTEGEA